MGNIFRLHNRHPHARHSHDPKRKRLRGAAVATLLPAPLLLAALFLAGCHEREVAQGAALYVEHCETCHGPNGRGQNPFRPWGSLAPEQEGWIAPALDMRGHCFVHPRSQLISIIRDGSPFPKSTMVGFKAKLSDRQILALISYMETLWDPNTRREYDERERAYTEQKN